ncbi:MAG: hypothetical protein RIQ54_214 [Candidatus Parcubacteria bacterium]|jgi:hypothetical protein
MATVERYVSDNARKKRSKRMIIRGALVASMATLLVCGLIRAVWYTDWFQLRHVVVETSGALSNQEVQNIVQEKIVSASVLSAIFGNSHLFVWPREKVIANIENPYVASIQVITDWMSRTVTISAKQKERFGIWCQVQQTTKSTEVLKNPEEDIGSGVTPQASNSFDIQNNASCWWFDREGRALERSPAASGSLVPTVIEYANPSIVRGDFIINQPGLMDTIIKAIDLIRITKLAQQKIVIHDRQLQEFSIELETGSLAYISMRFPPDSAFAVLESFKKKGKLASMEYIDFRVENRAFYKQK